MSEDEAVRIWRGIDLPERADRPDTLLDGIRRRVEANPESRIWTVDHLGRPVETSYESIWPRASAIAEGLRRANVVPGSTVTALTGTMPETVAVFWGCLMGGWTFLPLMGRARRARDLSGLQTLRDILSPLRQPTILASGEFEAEARLLGGSAALDLAEIEERGAGSSPTVHPVARPVCWLPTSGTTGRDKLAGLDETTFITRQFVRRNAEAFGDEVSMWVYDADSVGGLNCAFVPLTNWVQVSPAGVLAKPLLVLDLAARLGVARIGMTCSLARLVADAAEHADGTWDFSALSRFAMGGETVDPIVAERLGKLLRRHGAAAVRITVGYGTTETGSLATGGDCRAGELPVGLGGPAPGVSLRIVGEDGSVLPEGSVGIVEAFAPGLLFSGYADAQGAAAGFRPDGWWRTGDLGRFTEGQLTLHGRVNEVISVRGRKVALTDVDAALLDVVNGEHRAVSCRFEGDGGEALGIMLYGSSPVAEHVIRHAVGERFGIQPARIGYLPMEELPLGLAGKLPRGKVAEQLRSLAAAPDAEEAADGDPLEDVWLACLPRAQRPGPQSHFFADGGDSLAAQRLMVAVESRFGVTLRPGDFFADPTLGHLAALVDGSAANAYVAAATTWALPPELHNRLATQMEGWPGERVSQGRLILGLNTAGSRPPLFWVFQSGREFGALADALGADQPLYGFRSGHAVHRYDEDTLQRVVLNYVQDVLAVCPDGPLFVGGNCQGGRVALAIAQHLMRRAVDVRLLVLMDWGFELSSYSGPVLFLHGAESLQGNPWLRHAEPELAWRTWLREVSTDVIPGQHGRYFQLGAVGGLAAVLARHLAVRRSPVSVTRAARNAEIVLSDQPRELVTGQTRALSVSVRNASSAAWPAGLSLGNYWLDKRGARICWSDAIEKVPSLDPGAAHTVVLRVRAPRTVGLHELVVDMVAESGRWFDEERRTVRVIPIDVTSPWRVRCRSIVRDLTRMMPRRNNKAL